MYYYLVYLPFDQAGIKVLAKSKHYATMARLREHVCVGQARLVWTADELLHFILKTRTEVHV